MLKLKNPFEVIFIFAVAILMLNFALLVSFVGKNLTYTTRFTPPSTERSLKNETYFTECQVLIVAFGGLLIIILPALCYTVFMKSKRFFLPIWGTYTAVIVLLILSSLYYISGSQNYRDFLSQISSTIDATPDYCSMSLCNMATCARMSSYNSSRKMTEAFCVIGTLCSLYVVGLGFFINLRRRKTNEIELIM